MKSVRMIILGTVLLSSVSVAAKAQQRPAAAEITVRLTPQEWTILINSAQSSLTTIIAKIQSQYQGQVAAAIKARHTPPIRPVPPRAPAIPPKPPGVSAH